MTDMERPEQRDPPVIVDAQWARVRWAAPRNAVHQLWLRPTMDTWEVILDMLQDARVAQAVTLVKSAVGALGYSIVADGLPEEQADEATRLVEHVLSAQEGPLSDILDHLMSAFEWGYSVTWLDWGPGEGLWKGKWVVRRFLPLPAMRYIPEPDESGAVRGIRDSAREVLDEEMERYILVRWNARLGSPYGVSQLHAAREAWWAKTALRRYRNMALERFGSPFVLVRVPKGTPRERREEILEEVVKNFASHGGGVLNDDERIELIRDSSAGGADAFQRALEWENLEIMAAISGATLHMDRSGGGSYAQARVHQEMFLYTVDRLATTVEAALNEQLISRLLLYNYGPEAVGRVYIRWNRAVDNTEQVLKMVQALVPLGVVSSDEPWIRERLGLPEKPEEAEPLMPWWKGGDEE